MKTKYLVCALAILSAAVVACTTQQHEVELTHTAVVQPDCKVSDPSVYIARGQVDLSATQEYLLAVRWQSNLGTSSTDVNGKTIDTTGNNFFGDKVTYTYASTPAATYATETENQSFFIGPNASADTNYILVNALQPKAVATLLPLAAAGPVSLDVTVQVSGHFEDGASGETNKFTFPITVVESGFTGCAAGQVPAPATACDNFGQDMGSLCVDAGT